MSDLLQVVQELSLARDLPTVQRIVRQAARRLTGCDGATFVLKDAGNCFYADEDAIAPLWKGLRFPLETCISGWSMLHKQPAVIPDIYADSRIPHAAYQPTFVKSLVMVPIRRSDPIGAIGNYWAVQRQPTAEEVQLLQALADCTSVAIENVQLYQNLEQRVVERTRQLSEALNEIEQLTLTDELTGLRNRRGFHLLGSQALRHAERYEIDCCVLFMDLDGLKRVNDELGHEAGDAMIAHAAAVLRQTFRESDIVARLGGDEFAVLAMGPGANHEVEIRLQKAIASFNSGRQPRLPYTLSASVGQAYRPAGGKESLESLLAAADAQMYRDKRSKTGSRLSEAMPL